MLLLAGCVLDKEVPTGGCVGKVITGCGAGVVAAIAGGAGVAGAGSATMVEFAGGAEGLGGATR